jgi:hypothetical protein
MLAVQIAGYGVPLISGFEALLEKVTLSSQAAVNIVVWHLACVRQSWHLASVGNTVVESSSVLRHRGLLYANSPSGRADEAMATANRDRFFDSQPNISVVLLVTRNKRSGVICINVRPARHVMSELQTQTKIMDGNDTL